KLAVGGPGPMRIDRGQPEEKGPPARICRIQHDHPSLLTTLAVLPATFHPVISHGCFESFMPLARNRRIITRLLQKLGKKRQVRRQWLMQLSRPRIVRVSTRQ